MTPEHLATILLKLISWSVIIGGIVYYCTGTSYDYMESTDDDQHPNPTLVCPDVGVDDQLPPDGGVMDSLVEQVIQYLRNCPRYNETSSRHVYLPEGRRVGIEWDAERLITMIGGEKEYECSVLRVRLKEQVDRADRLSAMYCALTFHEDMGR